MAESSRHSSSRRHHSSSLWNKILITIGLKKRKKKSKRQFSQFSYIQHESYEKDLNISETEFIESDNLSDKSVEVSIPVLEKEQTIENKVLPSPDDKTPESNVSLNSPQLTSIHHRQHPSGHQHSKHKKHKKSTKLGLYFQRHFGYIKEPLYNFLYFLNLRSVPYDPYFESETVKQEDRKPLRIQRYVAYMIQSTLVFIISYIVAYLIYQMAVIFMAAHFGIDSVLYYYEVMFPIGDASNLWTSFNIIMITLAGPFVSLILGLIWYRWVMRKVKNPATKLFFLWLAFHSLNMFLGAFVAGVITGQGFGYVANWLYMGIPLKIFFSLVALGVLTYLGWKATPQILSTSGSVQRINRYNRSFFILSQMIIPWFLGSILMLWIKIPNRIPQHENILLYDIIILGAMAFLVIPSLFNHKSRPSELKKRSSHSKTSLAWLYLFLALFLIVAYRFGLERGLHIVIQFNLSLGFYQ